MTSTRPYLIRAFYDWIVDNQCTPHMVVNAAAAGVDVPQEYVKGGQIVLNIAVHAVQGLILGEYAIEFQTRFGSQIRTIYAPIPSILAIYAKENGKGMVFAEDDYDDEATSHAERPLSPPLHPVLKSIDGPSGTGSDKNGNKGGGKRPHLTIVK